jgi:hypothetical protein
MPISFGEESAPMSVKWLGMIELVAFPVLAQAE